MQSYDDSLNALLAHAPKYELKERIGLDRAYGRILGVNICAQNSYPSVATAAMDGYACRASDLKAGAKLKIIDKVPAGSAPKKEITQGSCAKTFTGSLISNGADTLIPIENVSANDEYIIINEVVKQGFAVRAIGESYFKDELLLKAGSRLDFSELALLAELGWHFVDVLARPRAAILATGSELVDLGSHKKQDSQIYSSNGIALASIAKKCGCQSVMMPLIKDDKKELENAVYSALQSCDILLTSGGVSVGDFDFMRDFVRCNGEIIIDKAAIKPGRHIKIVKLQNKFIFALPGFSYSAMVTAMLYFRPFVAKMLGADANFWHQGILQDDYKKRSDFEEFVAATLSQNGAQITLSTQGKKRASSAVGTNLNNNAVLIRANKEIKAGDVIQYTLL